MPKDLVFEIGTEEMPAGPAREAVLQLQEKAEEKFEASGLTYRSLRAIGTPRRLVLIVKGLAERAADKISEVRGPAKNIAFAKNGRPTPAAVGFAKSQVVAVKDLVVKDNDQGSYVYAVKKEKGELSSKLLPQVLSSLVTTLSFPKAMRWGTSELRFIRPIRWILAVYGGAIIRFELDGLQSGRKTYGHRFLSKNPAIVRSASKYERVLAKSKVLVDHLKRQQIIETETHKAAARPPRAGGKGRIVDSPKIFGEVLFLVEWPHAVCGEYSRDYLKIPREVIVAAMESHQRYFPVEDRRGNLLPYFVVVHNGDVRHSKLITRGHERVLNARLADARFFYEEDQKVKLRDRVDKLRGVVFHGKLGTLYDKTVRVQRLAGWLARELNLSKKNQNAIKRAARLANADLLTEMVGEFPELQGVMGREYGLLSGEREEVATAIYEHYLPRSAEDELPSTTAGQVLGIADKMDTIVGCFLLGQIPTGSQDPFGLRRQGRAIIGIIVKNDFDLDIRDLWNQAKKEYDIDIKEKVITAKLPGIQDWRQGVVKFFEERFGRYFWKRFDHSVVGALKDHRNFYDSYLRAEALSKMRRGRTIEDAHVAYMRCLNLRDSKIKESHFDKKLLKEKEEKKLYQAVENLKPKLNEAIEEKDYGAALKLLATLRKLVDVFFDEVLVMAEDKKLRKNRLALLDLCVKTFEQMADFSPLVPTKSRVEKGT